MAKQTSSYRCGECGWQTQRWVGRCGECQAWGSVAEARAVLPVTRPARPVEQAVPITEVDAATTTGVPTGITELDRVLGCGLTPGAVVLLAGEPGVGKSTLLLEVAARWARAGRPTLYVTAEESAAQVRQRAERTGALHESLYLAAESDLGTVLGHIEALRPGLLVLDSVQTVSTSEGTAGGVTQVREVTSALVRVAKQRNLPVVLIGHVTKDGAVAGPRTLEHLVDVVLSFEGDRHSGFRMLRAGKNRYGPADEVGCFELGAGGIAEVPDPSGLFMSSHSEPAAGTSVTVALEGRRPLLAEVQALVAPSAAQNPRRVTHGVDNGRVSMILAVLQRKAGLRGLHNKELYASTVGGARLTDPAADLAIAVAIASASLDRAFNFPVIALGEVGVSGELRRVVGLDRRLAEAARLGYRLALVPEGTSPAPLEGLRVVEAPTVGSALGALQLRREDRPRNPGGSNPGLRLAGEEAAW
jgi:DNA repair protein RadA/Sms